MNASAKSRSGFNRKLLAIPVIIIVVVAGVVAWQVYWQSSSAKKATVVLPALSLTLVGANGEQKVLDSEELAGLKSYVSVGGYITDKGQVFYGNFSGVPILTILALVGGITSNENVTVTGSDGYHVTFTYQQVQGEGLSAYDPQTKDPVQPTQPLTMIVAYYWNDTVLPESLGPLSLAIVGTQGVDTPGFYWVHLLVKIEVVTA